MTFSPGEASELLSIKPSTLRRYARLFTDHLSNYTRKRKRRYTQSDLGILAQVKELSDEGVRIADIPKHLESVIIDDELEETALALPGLITLMEDIQTSVDSRLSDQQEQIDWLKERLEELERDRQLPWYKRIFKRD